MTDIKPSLPASGGRSQAIIPHDMDSAYRFAVAIHKSNLAPKEFETPEKILVAILYGAEIGLPPMASLQSIAVINGRPALWGDAALALCLESPACEDIDEYVAGEGDERKAVCTAKRKGKEKLIARTFSVEEAKRAGLWSQEARVKRFGKDGKPYEKDNDSPWFRFPDRMLQMRARGFCLRDTFPHVLKGLHLREELEDGRGFDNARDVTPRHEPPEPPEPFVPLLEDVPPPPSPLKDALLGSIVEIYRDAAVAAKDVDELDGAWNTHIAPIEPLPSDLYEECMAIDDRERGRLES